MTGCRRACADTLFCFPLAGTCRFSIDVDVSVEKRSLTVSLKACGICCHSSKCLWPADSDGMRVAESALILSNGRPSDLV
ncbi:hypothetical protein O3P69_001641 [Scylla paramamosain]|uniref:Uncharacterized protein n=1 Tax=Scylla paramamosain TaxID=85552 RepID=A0AAW0UYL5_SCYPA